MVQEYLGQILSGLNALHTADLIHRGLTAKCIGLVPGKQPGDPKCVKLFYIGYRVRLLDMNRSEAFIPNFDSKVEDEHIPEGWSASLFYVIGHHASHR